MFQQIKPLSRRSDIVVQEFGNEVLIYDLKADKAFSLNQTSALIWQLCDGNKSISEITRALTKKLNAPIKEELVWLALEQLRKQRLLENESEMPNFFAGTSRREIIKRVGLSTLIALPFITSLIVPEAISAQSSVCSGNCRCPNGSPSCNGSTITVGGVSYVNCFTISGGLSNCDCVGPFDANNSAGSGFKASLVGCSLT